MSNPETSTARRAGVGVPRLVQWRVHGYAFVPVGGVAYVEAASEKEALEKAQAEWAANKGDILIQGSEDFAAAFDWQPSAEPLNAERTGGTSGPVNGSVIL